MVASGTRVTRFTEVYCGVLCGTSRKLRPGPFMSSATM
jgi:hypothetical protein